MMIIIIINIIIISFPSCGHHIVKWTFFPRYKNCPHDALIFQYLKFPQGYLEIFTLPKARRFYSSMGNPLGVKQLKAWVMTINVAVIAVQMPLYDQIQSATMTKITSFLLKPF